MKISNKILQRMMILQRQIGNLSGSLLFLLRGVDGNADNVLQEGYMNHMKGDISDLIKQCRLLATELGLDIQELEELGNKRYNEAYNNFRKKNKTTLWV